VIVKASRLESVHPLGDQGVIAAFVDEAAALRFATAARTAAPSWLLDVVQAYTTVAIFFDLLRVGNKEVNAWVRAVRPKSGSGTEAGPLHEIPCCYERQLDLARVAHHLGLAPDEVIRLHTSVQYTVYAIGFSPGFPYLGYLPTSLCGVPRLAEPRVRVEPGSVGLTGRQTGIYPEARPGGWNLIGQTPLQLVDVADGYFPLRTGDRVRFVRIDETTFRRRLGERLSND
jgi:inhibitor of KinA